MNRGKKERKLVEIPPGADWKEFRRECVSRGKADGARHVTGLPKRTEGVVTHLLVIAFADRGKRGKRKAKPAKPKVKVRPPFRPTKRVMFK